MKKSLVKLTLEVLKLVKQGKTFKQISEVLDVPESVVWSVRQAYISEGGHLPRMTVPKREGLSELVKMREDGYSFSVIGEKFGISKQRAHQLYKREKNND